MGNKRNDNLERVSYLIPKQLKERIDADAYELGFSRNNMITSIINQYYKAQDSASMIQDASYIMQKGVVIDENPDLYSATDSMKTAFGEVIKKYGGNTN